MAITDSVSRWVLVEPAHCYSPLATAGGRQVPARLAMLVAHHPGMMFLQHHAAVKLAIGRIAITFAAVAAEQLAVARELVSGSAPRCFRISAAVIAKHSAGLLEHEEVVGLVISRAKL